MSNGRTVATDALATLGTILTEPQKRDAIHIAVEPVTAGERLRPGEHITVKDGVALGADPADGLGIVDPFLAAPIKKGERFWFLMYPRMVTSLRHVWSHPAFPDEPEVTAIKALDADKMASERWLRAFIVDSEISQWSYEDVLKVALGGEVRSDDYDSLSHEGEYILSGGSDASGSIPNEFWDHVEIVTGQKVKQRASYFSCSC